VISPWGRDVAPQRRGRRLQRGGVADGDMMVAHGAVMVARGAVMVARGAVMVARGAVMVARGAVMVARGAVMHALCAAWTSRPRLDLLQQVTAEP
jgi:hypothetical protein